MCPVLPAIAYSPYTCTLYACWITVDKTKESGKMMCRDKWKTMRTISVQRDLVCPGCNSTTKRVSKAHYTWSLGRSIWTNQADYFSPKSKPVSSGCEKANGTLPSQNMSLFGGSFDMTRMKLVQRVEVVSSLEYISACLVETSTARQPIGKANIPAKSIVGRRMYFCKSQTSVELCTALMERAVRLGKQFPYWKFHAAGSGVITMSCVHFRHRGTCKSVITHQYIIGFGRWVLVTTWHCLLTRAMVRIHRRACV